MSLEDTIPKKRCPGYKHRLPYNDFYADASHSDGVQSRCITCKKLYFAEYRKRPERQAYMKAYLAQYRARRKETVAQRGKDFVTP